VSELLAGGPDVRLDAVHPGLIDSLARSVEDAVVSPKRATLVKLAEGLTRLVEGQFQALAPSIRKAAAHAPDAPSETVQAFRLGQISFAQTLVSQAAEQRADDGFLSLLSSSAFAPYIHALMAGELTSTELADAVGERPETVSRKLKQLREIGITDYRRDGQHVANFLTQTARFALPQPSSEDAAQSDATGVQAASISAQMSSIQAESAPMRVTDPEPELILKAAATVVVARVPSRKHGTAWSNKLQSMVRRPENRTSMTFAVKTLQEKVEFA
jgi:DNA-binding transcriptional ArsR family regulator